MGQSTSFTAISEQFANARLAAIVDSSFDAIISKNLNSEIQSWNLAAERMFGYSAEEAIGRSILMLIPESLHQEEIDIISRIRLGEQVPSFETVRLRKDGSLIQVSLTVSPIKDGGGRIVGASKIARDISEAKESERRIRTLMREVNHRVKNQFAVILSMIRETNKRASDPAEFEMLVRDRIMALSRSHDLLVESDWTGSSLSTLIEEHLKPFGNEDRITISGPLIILQPHALQSLGMALHELGTNSAKYGALRRRSGKVSISWQISGTAAGREFEMVWDEANGLDASDEVEDRRGFGTIVLKRVAPQALSGTADLHRTANHVRWTITAPLARVSASADGGKDDPHEQMPGLTS